MLTARKNMRSFNAYYPHTELVWELGCTTNGFSILFDGIGGSLILVLLLRLQQTLRSPLVEVWLGLLLSNQQYQWEQRGDFYRDAKDFWLKEYN